MIKNKELSIDEIINALSEEEAKCAIKILVAAGYAPKELVLQTAQIAKWVKS